MKVHMDNLLQRLDDIERRCETEGEEHQARLRELTRDKQRVEELLTIREAELAVVKREADTKLEEEKRRSQEWSAKVHSLQEQVRPH